MFARDSHLSTATAAFCLRKQGVAACDADLDNERTASMQELNCQAKHHQLLSMTLAQPANACKHISLHMQARQNDRLYILRETKFM